MTREKIIKYFSRLSRPIYLGEISIEIGYSLIRTENILLDMIDEGLIRYATRDEIIKIGAHLDAKLLVLSIPVKLNCAYDLLVNL